jgi:ubiquinone/menaquinone biosynthesis C-methylase UbiE
MCRHRRRTTLPAMTETVPNACQNFVVPADAYDRLMGRYLPTLAPAFIDAAAVRSGMRVLDVGCGPGGLTTELVARVGVGSVAAVDPSPPFVAACQDRNPGVDVRLGFAEDLPFDDDAFDATLASLVVGFMTDADAGAREMVRVTRPGGVVAACFWDRAGMPALRTFWAAAASLDDRVAGVPGRLGAADGEIAELLERAGAVEVEQGIVSASATYAGFADWWEPFTLGVGPAGAHYRSLDEEGRAALRAAAREALGQPEGPFTLEGRAWFARGAAPRR